MNPSIYIIGSDRSPSLAELAAKAHTKADVLVADILSPPHPRGGFDFVISVAVVHHLSTPERRVEAIGAILSCLKAGGGEGGAGEDEEKGNREGRAKGKALIYVWALEQKNSRRGWDEGSEQDQLVPWVMKGGGPGGSAVKTVTPDSSDAAVGGEVESGTESSKGKGKEEDRVFERYYHIYRKGELEADVRSAGGVVVDSGWEKDNWWVIATAG